MWNMGRVPLLVAAGFTVVGALMLSAGPRAGQDQARLPVLREMAEWFPLSQLSLPEGQGVGWLAQGEQGLLATVGLAPGKARRVSFCEQRAGDAGSALVPLALGFDWATVRSYAQGNLEALGPQAMHTNLKNPMIDGGAGEDVPAIMVEGLAVGERYPRLKLKSMATGGAFAILTDEQARVVMRSERDMDGGTWFFKDRAWLTWRAAGDGVVPEEPWQPLGNRVLALRRVDVAGCKAGGLSVQVWRPADGVGYRFSPVGAVTDKLLSQSARWRLAPGVYPMQPALVRREDAALFTRIQGAGLLRENPQGALTMPPLDATMDSVERGLLKTYYNRLPGRYVRKAVARYNRERLVLAVRVLSGSRERTGLWRGNGERMAVVDEMPLSAWALLPTDVPRGGWQRVGQWLASDSAQSDFWFRAGQMRKGDELELLVIGEVQGLAGAKVIERRAACLRRPCGDSSVGERLRLKVTGDSEVALQLRPRERDQLTDLFAEEFRHVSLHSGAARWQDAPTGRRDTRSATNIHDRNGRELFAGEKPSGLARELGLANLVGLHKLQTGSLANTLSRLPGAQMHHAILSIDTDLQRHAQAALMYQSQNLAPLDDRRRAGFVVMDADNGDILAAAGYPQLPADGSADDRMLAMEVVDAGKNALRVPGWQHDGSSHHAPGSTFKLVTALSFEQQAMQDPALAQLLEGVSIPQLRQVGDSDGFYFNPDAACYPAGRSSCRWQIIKAEDKPLQSGPAIANFGIVGKFVETPFDQARRFGDQHYGLEQAIRDSMNSWFAWLAERGDQTLFSRGDTAGVGHATALVPGALRNERPLLAMAERLGFGQSLPLDGGLLPEQWRYGFWDVLRSSASNIDPSRDRHGVRQRSLGLRMQAVPLQMARVSAAIATGEVVMPRLLLALDNKKAERQSEFLGVERERLMAGMARVPLDGTAKTAFSAEKFDYIRPKLFLKTGTASIAGSDRKLNNASITGFLQSGGLAGENRTLAFACTISYVATTGGRSCGQVLADFLDSLMTQQLRDQHGIPKNGSRFREKMVF